MNEDVFNTSLRGFLKKVGITSQREIEKAVRDAVAAGRLKGNAKLPAKMVLTLGDVSLTPEIPDGIELGYGEAGPRSPLPSPPVGGGGPPLNVRCVAMTATGVPQGRANTVANDLP